MHFISSYLALQPQNVYLCRNKRVNNRPKNLAQQSEMEQKQYKYYAFISYRSTDVEWAKWLQKKLEGYSLPTALQSKNKNLPKNLKPIFRDGTDIDIGELKTELEDKLDMSRYLIVLCSPRSAESAWVGDEIARFCESGRRDKIIALIIDGVPYCDIPGKECYHPTLKKYFPKGETPDTDHQLLGADIQSAGPESSYHKRERAFIQVVATILNLSFDDLWNRRRRQLITQWVTIGCVTLAVLAMLLLTWKLSGRPFDAQLRLQEQTEHNESLPFKDGTVTLIHGRDTLAVKQVNLLTEELIFPKLSGKLRNEDVRLTFKTFGYHEVDTVLPLSDQIVLPISRDNTFGIFSGTVFESDNTTPVAGVEVSIDSHTTLTNEAGQFEICLPISEQQTIKQVSLAKEGYQSAKEELAPQTGHMLVISRD